MQADLYCNILEDTLIPFISETLPNHHFMQDNDPKHTSRRAQAFFDEHGINWWRTPPESPDLNRIENVWLELKLYLESKVKALTKDELIAAFKNFGTKGWIEPSVGVTSIMSFRRQFQLLSWSMAAQPSIETF